MSSTRKRPPGRWRGYNVVLNRKPSHLCRVMGCPKDRMESKTSYHYFCQMHDDRIEKNLFKRPEEYCAERLMQR